MAGSLFSPKHTHKNTPVVVQALDVRAKLVGAGRLAGFETDRVFGKRGVVGRGEHERVRKKSERHRAWRRLTASPQSPTKGAAPSSTAARLHWRGGVATAGQSALGPRLERGVRATPMGARKQIKEKEIQRTAPPRSW